MKSDSTSGSPVRRTALALFCLLAVAASVTSSNAFTAFQFSPVQAQLTDDINTLSNIDNPSHMDRVLLRKLSRATNVLTKTSLSDGQVLRMLNNLLHRQPNYSLTLDT